MTMKFPIALVAAIVSLACVCADEVAIPQGSNVAPNGDRIEVTSKCLRLNGRAIIPLMGEMHYSRVPRGEWAASLKAMKDGGISIVSTYVFWNHHEWKEGKIDAIGLKPVSFGNSDSLSVGDLVYAVGNPLGELDFSMSTGHVSALDRAITSDESGVAINMFQIDAAVNSGNSGGPVYNAAGEVVGIVTAKYASTGVEGLGFAIPINDAVKIASDLITKGYVTGKAYMGVQIDQRYNSLYSQYYNMPLGAYVYSVEDGSCAEKAGLLAKDIITRLGDQDITGYTDLTSALHGFSAGDTTSMTVYRGGEEVTLTITFDEAKN